MHKEIIMKKAMLFIVAMMFSVAANAATLTLTGGTSLLSGGPVAQNFQTLSGSGTTSFDVLSDELSTVDFTIVENTDATVNVSSVTLFDGVTAVATGIFNGTGEWSFSALLASGVSYTLSIIASGAGSLSATTAISAVPVPAALFLFAPALLGFLGMRRKTAVTA
jgi:hypothetical protein